MRAKINAPHRTRARLKPPTIDRLCKRKTKEDPPLWKTLLFRENGSRVICNVYLLFYRGRGDPQTLFLDIILVDHSANGFESADAVEMDIEVVAGVKLDYDAISAADINRADNRVGI